MRCPTQIEPCSGDEDASIQINSPFTVGSELISNQGAKMITGTEMKCRDTNRAETHESTSPVVSQVAHESVLRWIRS